MKAISLFCGAGGCSVGFKEAGLDIVYACDYDQQAVKTYKYNFPECVVELKDLRNMDYNDLLVKVGLKPGELDVLIGGPPCQGFSTAGTRFWEDPRNELIKNYIDGLKIMKPKWFLMENVEGLLTANKGVYIYEAVKAMIELGYTVKFEKIYSQEHGVPQRRKRVIIVGSVTCSNFEFPIPEESAQGKIFRSSSNTLIDAISDLPRPKEVESKEDLLDHTLTSLSELNKERIIKLGIGQTMKDLPIDLQHKSFQKRANRRVKDGTAPEKRGGSPSGLKRLCPNEPSLTITSAATREFIHPFENRPLTIRECARLQTFPDSFVFKGSKQNKIKQIGNAIPPLIAYKFACMIKTYAEDREVAVEPKKGKLLRFILTKSKGYSPALSLTKKKLATLRQNNKQQISLF
jgi:DNA (cytosine-5)-methyltransferase 1